MKQGPRILLIGGTYRALCVLERLLERGERVVAFIGQEGGGERDFCPEILEVCDRSGIPARSGRKLGEEMVRWLEDRIRPELAIAVGVSTEIPLAVGGNCRLGLVEVVDRFQSASCPGVSLRQRGHETTTRALPERTPDEGADAYLEVVETTLELLEEHVDRIGRSCVSPASGIALEPESLGDDALQRLVAFPEPGAETDLLEAEARDYLGAEHVLALRDPEEAFALLCSALSLGDGDEVVCPGLASSSALGALRRVGARPVFADVDAQRLTLDPAAARSAITARTRALLLAHPFGQPAPLDALYGLAEERGLEVLEDAGASLGARFGGTRIGASPCACVFRFPLGTSAPGGSIALVTVPPALASALLPRAPELRLGAGSAHAARQRLARWEERLAARRESAAHYSSELCRYDAFQVPPTPADALPVYSHYALRLTRFARTSADDLGKLLGDSGIETRRIQVPAPERELARLPATELARASGLLLPVEQGLGPADRDRLLDAIFDYAIG
jgi:dTDP-4-amino-4,6-dideoxygalactose transaminase